MGFFDWLFGDDDPEPTNLISTSSTTIPEWISGPASRSISEAERLAGQPYTPYPFARLAPFNMDTLFGAQAARDRFGLGAGQTGNAYNMAMGAGGPVQPNEIANYLNPYIMNTAGITADELTRRAQIAGQGDNAQAAIRGAYGGSRHGIINAERERNLNRNISDVYTNALSTGYNTALGAAQQDRSRGISAASAAGQLSAASQNQGYQDINMLLGLGQMGQTQEQANLDLAYQDFTRQRDYPQSQLNFLSSIIRGSPFPQSTYMTNQTPTPPQPGFFQTAAGLGIAGLGVYNQANRNDAYRQANNLNPYSIF